MILFHSCFEHTSRHSSEHSNTCKHSDTGGPRTLKHIQTKFPILHLHQFVAGQNTFNAKEFVNVMVNIIVDTMEFVRMMTELLVLVPKSPTILIQDRPPSRSSNMPASTGSSSTYSSNMVHSRTQAFANTQTHSEARSCETYICTLYIEREGKQPRF